jgi:putative addiction module component (TIGR02574 family)
MTVEALTSAALALSPEERVTLAETLLASVDPWADVKYREEWQQEIKDRIEAYERGEMETFSREEVMRYVEEDSAE